MSDADTQSSLTAGEIIDGKYEVIRRLGVGGMGAVYLAKRLALEDLVAVKCILGHQDTRTNRKRFQREARAAARIRHPNVVQVFDFGEPARGSPYMVMEYLEGPTLERVLKNSGGLPLEEALQLFAAMCVAVEAGHRRGVIHRDLKPGNMILARNDDGRETLKVLDFGLARVSTAATKKDLTVPGAVMGTFSYMAPELIEGGASSAQSDVFALGVILYEMLAGTLPFSGRTQLAVAMRISEGAYTPLAEHAPYLSPEVLAAVESAFAHDPADRPSGPLELAESVGAPVAPASETPQPVRVAAPPPAERTMDAPKPRGADPQLDQATMAGEQALESAAPPPAPTRDLDAFVGREAQLEELDVAYRDAIEGGGRIVVIVGEPGVGKTRLLEQFCAKVERQGASVARGRFYAYEGDRPPPYESFLAMLAAGSSGASFDDIRDQVVGESGGGKWQVFAALAEAFQRRTGDKPLVLAVDDVQWASPLERDFLMYLQRRSSGPPVMVVGTARTISGLNSELMRWLGTLSGQRALTRLEVQRFGVDEVRDWFVATFHRMRIRPQDIRALHHATGGNPYYLSEVVRQLVSQDTIHQDGVGWVCQPLDDVALPDTVHNVLRKTFEELDDELRGILEVAGVIGEEFRFETLQAATGLDEDDLEDALERAVERRILTDKGLSANADYRFHNATLRNVLYAQLGKRKRRRTHAKVAEAIAEIHGTDPRRLAKVFAYHHHAIGNWEQALEWGLLAAEQALARYDNDSAEVNLRRAEDAAEELEVAGSPISDAHRAKLDAMLGSLYAHIGRFEEGAERLRRARERAEDLGDVGLQLDAGVALVECHHGLGEHEQGLEVGRQVIEDARAAGEHLRELEARVAAVKCAQPLGRPAESIELLSAITTAADTPDLARIRALGLRELARIHAKRGAFGEADAAAQETLRLAKQIRDALAEYLAVSVLGLVYGESGDVNACLPYLERALELGRSLSLRRRECIDLFNLGEIYQQVGRLENALEANEGALAIALEIRDRSTEGLCRVNLGRLLREQGKHALALEMLEQGQRLCGESRHYEYEALAANEIGEYRLQTGELGPAAEAFERAEETFAKMESFHRWRPAFGLARVARARGDVEAALAPATRARASIQRFREQLSKGMDASRFNRSLREVERFIEDLKRGESP